MNKKFILKALALLILGVSTIVSVFILNNAYNGTTSVGVFEAIMGVFFTSVGFLIVWASCSLIENDLGDERIPLYYGLVVSLIGSLCGIVFFNNLIAIFIFIELSAFLAAGLVMIKNKEENYRAGIKYLMLSILASAIFLIGIVILYRLSGTLNISEIKGKLDILSDITLIKYSFIFIFIGIALKSALFPFHIWLPNAYNTAPASSSAILSGLVSKVYIVLFIKLIYRSYGIELVSSLNVLPIILILGVCGMIYGSLLAIMQDELKRMIAYSSVAQIGYIFMGIGLGNKLGLYASVFHVIAHGVTKSCLFLNSGTITMKSKYKRIDHMTGLGKSLPITFSIFTICGLSMIGIPLLVGFSSKWNFAQAIVASEQLWVIGVLSLSSLLNGLYFLPVVIKAFFSIDESRERKDIERVVEKPTLPILPIALLGALVIVLGIFSYPLYNLIEFALINF